MTTAQWLTSAIAGLAMLGVILRPFRLPEACFAASGALLLVLIGCLSPGRALAAVAKGTDVYFFLIGMMMLAEIARGQGLFDWLAARAVRHAKGSPRRPFALIYAVGTLVTVFMSNDATAVVLTPAVYAAAKAAGAKPALSLCLCLHRQCGELRASHFQSGKSRRVRRSYAAALGLAHTLRLAFRGRNRCDLCRAALHAPQWSARRVRPRGEASISL